jgi:hypothetical protein
MVSVMLAPWRHGMEVAQVRFLFTEVLPGIIPQCPALYVPGTVFAIINP